MRSQTQRPPPRTRTVTLLLVCLHILSLLTTTTFAAPAPQLSALTPHAQDLARLSTSWMDERYDPVYKLLRTSSKDFIKKVGTHTTRETLWYSIGLFLRNSNNGSDHDLAIRSVRNVIDHQINSPNNAFHGTFRRAPEDSEHLPANAHPYRDYDPNWREFCGTALIIILTDFESMLPPDLVARIEHALRLAAEGTRKRESAPPRYTNVALMRSFLLRFVGDRLGIPEFVEHAEEYGRRVYELWGRDGAQTLWEYNSPTYYGPDIFALVLWTRYLDPTSELVKFGGEMLEALWKDIGEFYHAGLKNFVGPYDRSYGIDMTRYHSLIAQWIWLAVGHDQAPVPDLTRPFDHPDDWCFAPMVALLSPYARIPPTVLPRLQSFTSEHTISRVVASTTQSTTSYRQNMPQDDPRNNRIVTSWLGENVMIGAEICNETVTRSYQFHPATLHWRLPTGGIGWFRMVSTARHVVAKAGPARLEISHPSPPAGRNDHPRKFEFLMGGFSALDGRAEADALANGDWRLPGLAFSVVTNAIPPKSIVTVTEDLEGSGAGAVYSLVFNVVEQDKWVVPSFYLQILS